MVENKATQIIISILGEYIIDGDVKFASTNNWLNYYFKIHCGYQIYSIHLAYEFVDSYYKILIEDISHNKLENVIFLTRSKAFHKKVKSIIKSNKLNNKSFLDHVTAFSIALKNFTDIAGSFNELIEIYPQDLKFDGYFV